MEYYKEVDKSFFKYGFTVPKRYVDGFLNGMSLKKGTSRDVRLLWGNKKFTAKIVHVDRRTGGVYQVRWDHNSSFKLAIKKEFIQSYIVIESQNHIAQNERRYYVTNLSGGNQEVMIFEPISMRIIW